MPSVQLNELRQELDALMLQLEHGRVQATLAMKAVSDASAFAPGLKETLANLLLVESDISGRLQALNCIREHFDDVLEEQDARMLRHQVLVLAHPGTATECPEPSSLH